MDRKRSEDTEFNFSPPPFYISLFYSETFSKDISKKRMLISGPEFLFVHMRISPISGVGGEKCNILFCKYFYHSLREFVKMWSLDIWKNGDGFKIIAMDRFH